MSKPEGQDRPPMMILGRIRSAKVEAPSIHLTAYLVQVLEGGRRKYAIGIVLPGASQAVVYGEAVADVAECYRAFKMLVQYLKARQTRLEPELVRACVESCEWAVLPGRSDRANDLGPNASAAISLLRNTLGPTQYVALRELAVARMPLGVRRFMQGV